MSLKVLASSPMDTTSESASTLLATPSTSPMDLTPSMISASRSTPAFGISDSPFDVQDLVVVITGGGTGTDPQLVVAPCGLSVDRAGFDDG